MTTPSQALAPWLLGDTGAPFIPPTWAASSIAAPAVAYVDGSIAKKPAQYMPDLARPAQGRQSKAAIDWPETSRRIVMTLARAVNGWASQEVGTGSDFVGHLRDLPLLSSTRQTLDFLGFNGDASLSVLAELKRDMFLSTADGPWALLDLSVTLECWWPWRNSSPMHLASERATTLEEVAEALVSEYLSMDGSRLDERWIRWILRRQSWGMPQATLDEIGREADVTRERIRQVMVRLSDRVGQRIWPLPRVVTHAIEALQDNGFRGVQEVLLDAGFVIDEDWTPQEISELLRWLGYSSAADNLDDRFDKADEELAAEIHRDARLISAIRRARSGMGFMRVNSVEHPDGGLIPPEIVIELLPRIYARVFQEGEWALAGDADLTTSEGSVRRQLGIRAPLPSHELYTGLDREQRRRSLPKIPPPEIALSLLTASQSLRGLGGDLYEGPTIETDPTTINGWLAALLEQAEGHVLHKEVINRMAIRDGKNLTSLGVYISFSYAVRPADRPGLYRLIGTSPSQDDLDHAYAVAEATRVPSQLTWSLNDQAIDLSLTVGSNLLSMGSLPVDAALRELWPSPGARIGCFCSGSFTGRVIPYGDSSLSNWATLLTHLAKSHGLREGSVVSLLVTGDQLTARTVSRG